MTAEADSSAKDEKELLDDYGLLGCHSSRSHDLLVQARIDSSGYIRFYKMMTEMDMQQSLRSSLAKRQKEQPQNRASDLLSSSLLIWSPLHHLWKAATSVQLRTPFSQCNLHHTKKRHLVTRSGLPRLRCCVYHLHHKWAMKSTAAVRQFFKTVLQQVCHFKVDVIAGDANAAA